MLYRTGMWTRVFPLGGALALFGASLLQADEVASATTSSHRYAKIAPRNVFGVKPPPPPATPEPVVEPPKEKPDFFLTGLTSINGEKRAFITFQRKGGTMQFPGPLILGATDDLKKLNGEEDESSGAGETISLVSVNEDEGSIRISYNGEEVSLNFEDNGMKATAGPTGAPPGGLPAIQPNGPRGSVPPPPMPAIGAPFNGVQPNQGGIGGSGPTVIGRGGQILGGFGNNNFATPNASLGNGGLPAIQPNAVQGGVTVPPTYLAPINANTPSTPGRAPRQAPPAPFPSVN